MRPPLLCIVDFFNVASETERCRDLGETLCKTVERGVEVDHLEDIFFFPAWLVDGGENVEQAHDVAKLQHERCRDAVQVGHWDREEGFKPLLDCLGAAEEMSGAIYAGFVGCRGVAT